MRNNIEWMVIIIICREYSLDEEIVHTIQRRGDSQMQKQEREGKKRDGGNHQTKQADNT